MKSRPLIPLLPFILAAACSDPEVANRRSLPPELETEEEDPVLGGRDAELAQAFALTPEGLAAQSSEAPACESTITQPLPPSEGYGSLQYVSTEWKKSIQYGNHSIETRTYFYGPGAKPAQPAPVILYLPGYSGSTVGDLVYRDMMVHFARKGYYVVYVTYGSLADPWNYEANAVKGMRLGLQHLAKLEAAGVIRHDPNTVIYAGHSLGTILTHRIANKAATYQLPVPKAIIAHDGEGENAPTIRQLMPINDLKNIPATTRQFFLSAETSLQVKGAVSNSNNTVAKLFHNAKTVPSGNKSYLVVPTDTHGCPQMISDHYGMLSGAFWQVDAVDWWAYRRYTEAALALTLTGQGESFFKGTTPDRTYLGLWSDQVPVKAMRIDVTVPQPTND